MHYFSNLFDKVLYMFRTDCPSSGVSQYCIHAIGICDATSVGDCWRGHDGTQFHPDHASRRQQK